MDNRTRRELRMVARANILSPRIEPDHFIHTVGDLQHWLDRLGLKIPRALCGVLLEGNPGEPELPADAPACPRCAALNR